MPVYEYAHSGDAADCPLGREFETTQRFSDDAFTACPKCGAPVQRLISRTFINVPQSNSDLKSQGFAKLVKRDTGVYENVTALDGESRYMLADKPETMPNLKKRVSD